LSEVHKFSLKVLGVPKKQVVKVFTTNRPDQSLNKGMGIGRQLPGHRTVRNKPSK